jgi:hypothetical protein
MEDHVPSGCRKPRLHFQLFPELGDGRSLERRWRRRKVELESPSDSSPEIARGGNYSVTDRSASEIRITYRALRVPSALLSRFRIYPRHDSRAVMRQATNRRPSHGRYAQECEEKSEAESARGQEKSPGASHCGRLGTSHRRIAASITGTCRLIAQDSRSSTGSSQRRMHRA